MMLDPEGWGTSQKILVILAHPDDPEFFCGATLARWIGAGHSVEYCVLTHGEKGGKSLETSPEDLAALREVEQKEAAKRLGVASVRFLNFKDGELFNGLKEREAVTRVIRQVKPDIVVGCDPQNYFPRENAINHPDHRAAGEIVLGAFFPSSGNVFYFSDQLVSEGLETHSPKELWLSLTTQPNIVLDITEQWPRKINALCAHASQIGKQDDFISFMNKRHTPDSTDEAPRYEERFRRFIFGK
jgi:LmbE family N-acetylglucosaminyl deacetylase